jgi:hypothetical protein
MHRCLAQVDRLEVNSGERRARGAQGAEEMMRAQQLKQDDGDMVMTEVGEGEDHAGGEATTGVKCSCFTKRGHFAAGCKAEIDCVICDKNNDHVNHKCPFLKMPRPMAHAAGYAVHGLGFYHIPRPPLPQAKKDSRTTLKSVEGGQVPMEKVKRQLERLFSGKWTWEIKAHEDSSFLAKFPSKVELQRAITFGGADIKGEGVPVGARLKFELWQEKEVGFLLPKVWVRVFGLRKELYEFLELWAVGSMIGSTQIVDMETTRKSDFGRILVAVLNPSLIPEQLDVVIGDHYFELEFEGEKVGIDENGVEVEFDWHRGVREKVDRALWRMDRLERRRGLKGCRRKMKRVVDSTRVKGAATDAQGGGDVVLS